MLFCHDGWWILLILYEDTLILISDSAYLSKGVVDFFYPL